MADTDAPAVEYLVVVGASAGGVEALATLVETLPADFPAPVVIAQHLDPHRLSHLGEILARHGALPVRSVEERETLESGVLYVVPANRHVEISDHQVTVRTPEDGGPKPSVDRLLSSAARVFGERLIAVILTGTGSDGAAGAREVKQHGGTVVIQNPQTASYPGMPRALAPAIVDLVVNLPDLGARLRELLGALATPEAVGSDHELRDVLAQIRERSGIDFSRYKPPTIHRRLHRRVVATRSGSLAGYERYLRDHAEEYDRLVSSFLIKVTEFFRDPELFAHMRERIIPELIAAAREHGKALRLWSAGCATGEEAYSLAMLVAEALGDDLHFFNIRIFSTDLDEDALAFGRRGIYSAATLASVPPEFIERYFVPAPGGYAVHQALRNLVIFGQHDLAQRAAFPRIDLIVCRNVLIYFTTALQQRALRLFAFSLRDGGYLALGKAETTSPQAELFDVVHPLLKVYRRRGDRSLLPLGIGDAGEPATLPRLALPRAVVPRPAAPGPPTRDGSGDAESSLLQITTGVVVVDRRYDIIRINAAAHRLLGIYSAAIGEDMLHLLSEDPLHVLRAAIDAALRGERPPSTEIAVTEPATGEERVVRLTCGPMPSGEQYAGPVEAAVVEVVDVTEAARGRRELAQLREELARVRREHGAQAAATEHQHQDELVLQAAEFEQLRATGRRLLAANDDLTRLTLELQARTEMFVINSEEAQAMAEEAETLNEELQATNEELTTLNEEQQATVEELQATNAELLARGVQLEQSATDLSAQRAMSDEERERLAAILGGIADAVLVVDRSGRQILANAAYQRFFGDGTRAPTLEADDGSPLPGDATPRARAARGETFSMTFAAVDGGRRWLEAIGQPIGGPDGPSVIVFRDITERSLRRLQDEFLALASHELRTPLTVVLGNLDRLARRLPPDADPRQRDQIAQARTQARRMAALITDLLDVARLQQGNLPLHREPVDMRAVAEQTVAAAETLTRGQTIRLDAGSTPVVVHGDADRLQQVLLNLLTNAVTYAADTAFIDVRLRADNGWAELQVQDYGPGIAPEEAAKLFTRFYQVGRADRAGEGGLGLGLFLCHEITAAHGGTIAVDSTLGQGATFTMRLPLSSSPLTPRP